MRTADLKSACALVQAGGRRGTGFLVAPDAMLTCYHVVQDALQSDRVRVVFSHGEYAARVSFVSVDDDCALLRLEQPVRGGVPLALARKPPSRSALWQSYGHPRATETSGLLIDGVVQDESGEDPRHRPSLVLRSDNVTAGAELQGFSGSPVIINGDGDGEVIGLLRQIVPDARNGAQLGILYACPARNLLTLLHQGQPTAANPYRGLMAFQIEDAGFFFGREALTAKLLKSYLAMRTPKDALRVLALVGPSGCGKSSVVRAGLLAALSAPPDQHEAEEVIICRPGERPIESLARALLSVLPAPTGSLLSQRQLAVEEILRHRSAHAEAEGLRRITAELEGRRLLVFVDQFEELYALSRDPSERDLFVELLLHAAGDGAGLVSVVLTLRSDFLGETQRYHPALSRAIADRHELTAAMAPDELRSAIASPAAVAGSPLDDATIELLLTEVKGNEAALPLLEFALTEIWNSRQRGASPLSALREMGGVGGAMAGRARAIFAELPPEEQAIARRALVRLVQLGEGRDTRRRVALRDLCGQRDSAEQVLSVLRRFAQAQARLITLATVEDEVIAEVTHEALFEHWSELRSWIESNRADRRFHDRLAEAAKLWDQAGRAQGRLWRTPDLDLLRAYERRRSEEMTELQTAFFGAAEQQQDRERRLRRIQVGIVFALILSLLSLIGIYALKERQRLRDVRQYAEQVRGQLISSYIEEGRRMLLDDRRTLGLMWLQRAYEDGRDTQALRYMLAEAMRPVDATAAIYVGHTLDVYHGSFSPDGSRVVTAGRDGTARIWETATGKCLQVLQVAGMNSMDDAFFTSDGRQVITLARGGHIKVWDSTSGALVNSLSQSDHWYGYPAVSPDGKRVIYLGYHDKLVRCLDLQSRKNARPLWSIDKNNHGSVRFSPDGTRVLMQGSPDQVLDAASGAILFSLPPVEKARWEFSEDGSRLFSTRKKDCHVVDATTGKLLFNLEEHKQEFWHAAFSRNGKWIATGGDDGAIRLFSAVDGTLLAVLEGHRGAASLVAFTPDSTRLITAGQDQTVRIWDTSQRILLETLEGNHAPIWMLSVSPDGAYALTSSGNRGAQLLSIVPRQQPRFLKEDPARLAQLAFSPDGERLVTLSAAERTIRIWDARSGALLATPKELNGERVDESLTHRASIAFSAASDLLMTAFIDAVHIWEVRSGALVERLHSPDGDPITSAAISPDGTQIAVLTVQHDGDSMHVLDVSTKAVLVTAKLPQRCYFVTYSLDGKRLFVTNGEGQIPYAWDVTRRKRLYDFENPTHSGALSRAGMFISPNGNYLAESEGAGIITLRLIPGGSGRPLTFSTEASTLDFSPDSTQLLIRNYRTAAIWDIEKQSLRTTLEGHQGTLEDAHYSRDGSLIFSVGTDRFVRIWEASTGKLLAHRASSQSLPRVLVTSPDGSRFATIGRDGTAAIWSLQLEKRSPAEIARLIRCRVPYRFDRDQESPVPAQPEVGACPPSRAN